MASIAVALPRSHPSRLRSGLGIGALCVLAASLYGWMRIPLGNAQFAFDRSTCVRFEMAPSDWPCAIGRTSILVALVAGALLTGLALALPGVILAAAGRRFTAIIPVTLAAVATGAAAALSPNGGANERLFGVNEGVLGSGQASGFWLSHAGWSLAVDAVLVSVPAFAVVFLPRPATRSRPREIRRHASWVATFAVIGSIAIARMIWARLPNEDFFVVVMPDTLIATGTMALFAAMLGTDRRWWPWSIVPVALFLSLGPSMAVASIPSRFTALTWFGSVAPLVVSGLIGSAWRPLAERLSGVQPERATAPPPTGRVRPTVVLNALAAALLFVALLAARFDPLGVQISTSLPTYLGQRQLAEDVRTKTNLSEAIAAAERYRETNGTFAGFDAAAGEGLEPRFRWLDRVSHQPLVVTVNSEDPDRVRLLAQSSTGRMFCLQGSATGVSYGVAEHRPPSASGPTLAERALSACDAGAFTPQALAMFDVAAMCEGADDPAIVLCRNVQALIRATLASPAAH